MVSKCVSLPSEVTMEDNAPLILEVNNPHSGKMFVGNVLDLSSIHEARTQTNRSGAIDLERTETGINTPKVPWEGSESSLPGPSYYWSR